MSPVKKKRQRKSTPDHDMRQVIIINADLKMSPGKVASQACHAAVNAALSGAWCDVAEWREKGPTKIVLRATEKQMKKAFRLAKRKGLNAAMFTDGAPTTEGTADKETAVAIGPHPKSFFVTTGVTDGLKLY